MTGELRVPIDGDLDIVKARQEGRRVAGDLGFTLIDRALVATAISELARNIVRYAKRGVIVIRTVNNTNARGIQVVARDDGPGIRDIDRALQLGFSTSGGLGLGLSGVKRLMDEFSIQSRVSRGTVVTITKWKH